MATILYNPCESNAWAFAKKNPVLTLKPLKMFCFKATQLNKSETEL